MKLPRNFTTVGPPPYKYQMETIIYGIRNNSCGLLLDMGLGKTRCAIDIARYRIQTNYVTKVIVVVPTSIMFNWQKEIEKFSEYKSIILHSTNREERIARIRVFKRRKDYHFGIINYEGIPIFINELKNIDTGVMIFDESARYIKNHQANRTKAAIELADQVGHILILTGTPIANRPLDIWSQFRVLDGGGVFFSNFYRFRNWYFNKIRMPRYTLYKLKKERVEYLQDGIYSKCIRFKKEDVLPDLPDKLFYTIELPLDGILKSTYNTIKTKVLAEIATEEGTARLKITNILTKLLRLQTVTSGFIKGENGAVSKLKSTPKLDALIDEVESIVDAEEAVVIWVRFLYTIEMIQEELTKKGIESITMSGQDKDKYSKWKTFQESETIKVFIGQVESGGIGIELFKIDSDLDTQHMIFYENVYSLDVRDQAIDRIHRIGQKSICRYVDIVVKGTIDERILQIIKENKQVADMVLEKGVTALV